MKPLYIFDLDGTLALVEHRQHILADSTLTSNQRWRQFFAACVDDVPYEAVVRSLKLLQQAGADVWIWSARSDEVLEETVAWLAAHEIRCDYRLGRHGDRRPDTVVKQEWLDAMAADDRARLVAIFDDRDSVVAMWRANGVACFQVAPGAF